MERKTLVVLAIVVIFAATISTYFTQVAQPSQSVNLNITINSWSWGTQNITSQIIEVKEGNEFGPAVLLPPYQGTKPFKMLEVIDENSVKISYNGLIISGEQIAETTPKQGTRVISLEETCFRTPTLDSGVDICLKIVK